MDPVLALLWLLAVLVGGADDHPACLVLGGLDTVRAEAFASGDVDLLDDVYLDERAAAPDVAVLRAYRARGLELRGTQMERRRCTVSERGADRIVLDVVDRLGTTTVREAGGPWRALPRDGWTRHTVVLRRVGDAWRIGAVSSPRSSRR
jgi:hypothetical protein